MSMNDLILKKRNGGVLSEEEIRFIVDGYTDGSIPDYQMSAFLMAVWFVGMNDEETAILTMAMAESGDMLDLSFIKNDKYDGQDCDDNVAEDGNNEHAENDGKHVKCRRIIDKHSTGGVGDKTTLIIGPILAALGVPIAKMSGRGLGHTGGTIDKLESIPGFSSDLTEEQFIEQVKTVGFADMCQTKNLAPADKKIYALRDVTGTVDNYSLIASSVMSKKLAAGADGIVLDVKCGSGAFMKDINSARKLAEIMVSIGKKAGRDVTAVISDMNEPLGRFVGNTLEVEEAVEVLRGGGEERLRELSVRLAAEMLMLAEKSKVNDPSAASSGDNESIKSGTDGDGILSEYISRVENVIADGSALAKFKEFVEAQGGDSSFIDGSGSLPQAEILLPVRSKVSGKLVNCDTEKIGLAVQKLGGGREQLTDEIDPAVGIEICKHLGEEITSNDLLAVIYANDNAKASEAERLIREAYEIADTDDAEHGVILEVLR
ncbi:MAG: thymidine phosphorylase [Eubacterium sp.]|nr:thymidine phosphorylase [Eubacterium sp.]